MAAIMCKIGSLLGCYISELRLTPGGALSDQDMLLIPIEYYLKLCID